MATNPVDTPDSLVARYGCPAFPLRYGMITLDQYLDCQLKGLYDNHGRAKDPSRRSYFSCLKLGPDERRSDNFFAAKIATRICALDDGLTLPPRDALKRLLLACENGTLDELEAIDRAIAAEQGQTAASFASRPSRRTRNNRSRGGGERVPAAGTTGTAPTPLLCTPHLLQLVISLALTVKNKALVKQIAARYPATPHAELLFGAKILSSCRRMGPAPALCLIVSHPDFWSAVSSGAEGNDQGEVSPPDNGCDVWVDLLRNKWVQPDPEMLLWATTSPDEQAALSLLDELSEPCRGWAATQPETLGSTLRLTVDNTRYPSLVSRLLSAYNPARLGHPDAARKASRTAASRGPQFLKVLLEHGFGDDELYGLDRGSEAQRQGGYTDPIANSQDIYCGVTNETTALHAAAVGNAASVKFLLQRGGAAGVPRVKDGWGRDAYELVKHLRSRPPRSASDEEVQREQDEVIAIFERFGWHLAEGSGECRRGEDEGGDKGKGEEGEGDRGGEVEGVGRSRGVKRSSQGERRSRKRVKKSAL